MPSFDDFSKKYARQILEAFHRDGFTVYTRISVQNLRGSNTVSVLKSIKQEIDSLVYEGSTTTLSIADKNKIYEGLSRELRLPSLQKSAEFCEAASNDDLTDLVDTVDNILKGR